MTRFLVIVVAALSACATVSPTEEQDPSAIGHEGSLDVVGPGPFDPSQAIEDEPPLVAEPVQEEAGEEEGVTPPSEVSEARQEQVQEIEEAEEQGHTAETQERVAESPPRGEREEEDTAGDRVLDVGLEVVLLLSGAVVLTVVVQMWRAHPVATAVGCVVLVFGGVAYVVTQFA